jgi:hypothetical protein
MEKAKVKLSLYRPTGFQNVGALRISEQLVNEGGKEGPMQWPPLPQRKFLVLISVSG